MPLLLGVIGWPELIVCVAILLLLFGSSKIPQLMRGMGQGIGEFKKGLKEGQVEEEKKPDQKPPSDTPAA